LSFPCSTAPLLSCSAAAAAAGTTRVAFQKDGCIVYALRQVTVSTQATGVIVAMPVEEGDAVKAGQLLAQLDDTIARLNRDRLTLMAEEGYTLEEARIREDQAKEDYETAQKLAGVVRGADVRAAWRKYELAKVLVKGIGYQKALTRVDLDKADKQLDDHRICAPIDGVVVTKHRERGESVDADTQTPIVTLIDVSRLRAEALIPVERITSLRWDQRATVTCEVFPERTFEGRVAFIGPVVYAEVNQFKVKVEFADPSGAVRPGMRATVRILAAE